MDTIIRNLRDSVVTIYNSQYSSLGFFIKNHLIICPSIMIFKDYKTFDTLKVVIGGQIYPADILGYDGAGGLAILKLTETVNNPYLSWGKSRNAKAGTPMMILSTYTGPPIIVTIVSNNRYTYPGIHGELLQFSASSDQHLGAPIITPDGNVIGMCTDVSGLGLAEFFMRKPMKEIIKKKCFSFEKSFLGIGAEVEISGYRVTSLLDTVREIKIGDLICKINDVNIGNGATDAIVSSKMWRLTPGSLIKLSILRNGDHVDIWLTTTTYPKILDYPHKDTDLPNVI